MSTGDVGECRLRRDPGLSFDLAAVLRRMASCRFMEREVVIAGGDFFMGETGEDGDTGVTTTDWDLGSVGCEVTAAGGEVGEWGEDGDTGVTTTDWDSGSVGCEVTVAGGEVGE